MKTVYFVPNSPRHGKAREMQVEREGKVWSYLHGTRLRFKTATGRVEAPEGINSPGTVYESREQYETTQKADVAWRLLHAQCLKHYRCPRGLSEAKIREAYALLFPDVPMPSLGVPGDNAL